MKQSTSIIRPVGLSVVKQRAKSADLTHFYYPGLIEGSAPVQKLHCVKVSSHVLMDQNSVQCGGTGQNMFINSVLLVVFINTVSLTDASDVTAPSVSQTS